MKIFTKKLLTLAALFTAVQISYASIDTGLGGGNGGAVINNATGGLVDVTKGVGRADLNFDGNAHVNWNTLNVNGGEQLNFNAVNGANNLTILNTVNSGMSKIYGQINSNSGIGKLIISNPNGMLFDGAKFTTAGDLMLTTKDLSGMSVNDLATLNIDNQNFTKLYENGKLIPIKIVNSDFTVGGDYSIIAAGISAANSTINASNVKLVTANGQDYVALGQTAPTKSQEVLKMKAVNVNGNLYITNDMGAMSIENGGTINGNVKIVTQGNVNLNKVNNDKKLTINGDVDVKGNGARMFLRNADVDGKLSMVNGGGFLDVGDVHVTKDASLKTVNASESYDVSCSTPVKHFVHVIGNSKFDGNLDIESEHNIHIGGYDYDANKLADGNLTVGGNLNAHAKNGHVMTTIDTSANKISLKSDNYNVLTDGKATLKANKYEFSANGYIGGLKSTPSKTVDEKIVDIMENYIHIPDTVGTPGNVNIAGGTITKIDTPSKAYILSKGDVKLTGANAGDIHITAPDKYIEITGDGVHANNIIVGKETDKLKVDFPSRDYTLKYTNIRDAEEVTVNKTDVITYELTNGENGYNTREPRPSNTTYLVGPDAPAPDPIPDPDVIPDDNENIKVLRSYERPEAVDALQPYTPVAYAADLDDDEIDTGVRKNVDGSVTVVRAFPMIN